ncbi:MAG: CYTH domain-containing protein [Pseudoflavonifractor sp.]|nr:CYTH domain-containing protein [Pseudoflavonifractor sp.]
MAKEIERKFLVTDNSYRDMATEVRHIIQGYLSMRKEATVRVRIADNRGYLTVKGITIGLTRDEWEYEISIEDAREMMILCEGRVIDKERYIVYHDGVRWEVDCFHGEYEGLTVAEVELDDDKREVSIPPFAGEEVTGDSRYYNSVMAGVRHP